MTQFDVIKNNTKVRLGTDLPGIIKAVLIEGQNISYKIGYFNGATYSEVWLIEQEFQLLEAPERSVIGFK